MKKAATLEEFIKNYIENQAPKKEKLSYEAWVSKNGINAADSYKSSIRDADVAYAKGGVGYGRSGEAIHSSGLSNSGYSAYLNTLKDESYKKAREGALTEYINSTKKNVYGYRDYSDAFDADMEKQFTSVYNQLTSGKIANYDRAYDYAISSGLTHENAKVIAENATAKVREDLKAKAIDTALNYTLSKEEARQYALGLGLDYEDANEVALTIERMNDAHSSTNKEPPKYTTDGYPIY